MALEWSPWTVRAHLPPVLLRVSRAVGRLREPAAQPPSQRLGAALPRTPGPGRGDRYALQPRAAPARPPAPAPGSPPTRGRRLGADRARRARPRDGAALTRPR